MTKREQTILRMLKQADRRFVAKLDGKILLCDTHWAVAITNSDMLDSRTLFPQIPETDGEEFLNGKPYHSLIKLWTRVVEDTALVQLSMTSWKWNYGNAIGRIYLMPDNTQVIIDEALLTTIPPHGIIAMAYGTGPESPVVFNIPADGELIPAAIIMPMRQIGMELPIEPD